MDTNLSYLAKLEALDLETLKTEKVYPFLFDKNQQLYCIPGSEIELVAKTLNAEIKGPYSTNLKNIMRVELEKIPMVLINNWYGESPRTKELIMIITQKLQTVVKLKIIINSFHGQFFKPIDDDKFYIHLRATAQKYNNNFYDFSGKIEATETLSSKIYHYSGIGIPIYDEISGIIIAELIDNNLYIYPKLTHPCYDSERRACVNVYRIIIKKIINLLTNHGYQIAAKVKYAHLNREKFIKMNKISKTKKEPDLRANFQSDTESINCRIRNVEYNSSQKKQFEEDNEAITSTVTAIKETIKKELDKINNNPKIANCRKIGNSFLVETTPLICYNPRNNKSYLIGRMKININFCDYSFTVKNLDRTIAENHAPQIDKNGYTLDDGHLEIIITNLLAKQQLNSVINVLVSFCESVNINSIAGQDITKWPLAG